MNGQSKPVRVGLISLSANRWTYLIAVHKGFFEKAGVRVETTVTHSSREQMQRLGSGDLDVGIQSVDHVIRARQQGLGLSILGAVHPPLMGLIASPEIKTVGDLKGKIIGMDGAHTGNALLLKKILGAHGVTPEDVVLEEIGGGPQRFASLSTSVIDATLLDPPNDVRATDMGFNRLADTHSVVPDYPGAVIAVRDDFAEKNESAVRAFLSGYVEAVDWFYDPDHRAEAVDVLVDVLGVDRLLGRRLYEYYVLERQPFVRGASVSARNVAAAIELMRELGEEIDLTPEECLASRFLESSARG